MSETDTLLTDHQNIDIPSSKRWILCIQFSLLAFLQSSIFLSWNPIANSVLEAFGPQFTSSTAAWQINLATITSPVIQYPVWYSLKRWKIGKTLTYGAALPLVLSTALSSAPIFIGNVSNETYKILSYGSFLLIGDKNEEPHEVFIHRHNNIGIDFLQVLSSRNKIMMIIVLAIGSIPHIWGSTLLTVTFSHLDINQQFIGILTTLSLIASIIVTLILTRIGDLYFKFNLKLLIMWVLPIHAISMILMCTFANVGSSSRINNYQYLIGGSYIVAISTLNGITPVILELASEIASPISEDIVAGVVNQANNVVGVIFYLLFSYITINDRTWLNYVLMICPVVTFFTFSNVKEHYNRMEVNNDDR